jgi:hypothetical protein
MPRRGVLTGFVALAASVFAGCGGTVATTSGTCTLYQRSSQMYFVRLEDGTAAQVKQDCIGVARRLSAGAQGQHQWVMATPDASYGGDVLVCQAGGAVSLYAKPKDGFARALCDDLALPDPPRTVTRVVRFMPSPGVPVDVVFSGWPAETKFVARRFRANAPEVMTAQIVRRPRGRRDCRFFGLVSPSTRPARAPVRATARSSRPPPSDGLIGSAGPVPALA